MTRERVMDSTGLRTNSSSLVACAFRVLLGCMFLYTGFIHAMDPQGFAVAVGNYRVLPAFLVNPFAVALPWIELAAGALLVMGVFVPGSSLLVVLMLFMFTIALAMALAKGLDISCGCFTTSREAQRISWIYLGRDLGLLAMAVYVFFFDTGFASVRSLMKPRQ